MVLYNLYNILGHALFKTCLIFYWKTWIKVNKVKNHEQSDSIFVCSGRSLLTYLSTDFNQLTLFPWYGNIKRWIVSLLLESFSVDDGIFLAPSITLLITQSASLFLWWKTVHICSSSSFKYSSVEHLPKDLIRVVKLDRNKYMEKCLSILSTSKFA